MKKLIKLCSFVFILYVGMTAKAQCYVNAGQDQSICCAGGSVYLAAIPSITNCSCTNDSVNWSPSYGLSSPNTLTTMASPTVTTVYTVCVTAYNSRFCSNVCCTACDTITVYVNNSCCRKANLFIETKDVVIDGINVYPNPAKSDITIEFTKKIGNPEVILYNINGQKVWNRSGLENIDKLNADVGMLPKGVYFLKVYSEKEEVYSKKIILE